MKTCLDCKQAKHLASFPRKGDGTNRRRSRCSTCFNRRKTLLRRKTQPQKMRARDAAKKYFSGHAFKCSVATCEAHGAELHHYSYETGERLNVIPLCREHHQKIHLTAKVLDPPTHL